MVHHCSKNLLRRDDDDDAKENFSNKRFESKDFAKLIGIFEINFSISKNSRHHNDDDESIQRILNNQALEQIR